MLVKLNHYEISRIYFLNGRFLIILQFFKLIVAPVEIFIVLMMQQATFAFTFFLF